MYCFDIIRSQTSVFSEKKKKTSARVVHLSVGSHTVLTARSVGG
jgi:hypothetical protein